MNELMPIEDARAQVLGAIPAPLGAEDVDLSDALGRVLAADVIAATDLPPWDNSAMDGYAIRAADVAAATEDDPVLLRVAGEVAAGRASEIWRPRASPCGSRPAHPRHPVQTRWWRWS